MSEQNESNKAKDIFDFDAYASVLTYFLSDLIPMADSDKELFLDLFYNRESEYNWFKNISDKLVITGGNVLLVGKAGIGKSHFIHRLLLDTEMLTNAKLYPVKLDIQKISAKDPEEKIKGLRLNFIDQMLKYFCDLDYDQNDIDMHDNPADNMHKIQIALENLPQEKRTKHLLIFIDDMDYAEKNELYPILDIFLPFARSPKASILLAVRPKLEKIINTTEMRIASYFIRNVRKFPNELEPLDITSILLLRLAPLIAIPKKYGLVEAYAKLGKEDSSLLKTMKKLGITDLEHLKKMEYPFTQDYKLFMERVTDDNLREMLAIAVDSLLYIFQNYNKLNTIIDANGEQKKEMSNQTIIDLFYKKKHDSDFTLVNLHEEINAKGNSVHFNVLEAVRTFGGIKHRDFFPTLQKLGHNHELVENALRSLARRRERMLEASDFDYIKSNVKESVDYKITEKGCYYLDEITQWKEYIAVCGKSVRSLKEVVHT